MAVAKRALPGNRKGYDYFFDFSGGENSDDDAGTLNQNELEEAVNVIFNENSFIKRFGTVALNSASYNNKIKRLIEWERDNGDIVLLGVVGTYFCKIDETNNYTITNIKNVSNPYFPCWVFKDNFYFIEGNEIYYYDGTRSKATQMSAPTAGATVVASGSGSISGDYQCKVTFVNSIGVETLESQVTTISGVASKAQFDWSSIPIGTSECIARRLYRTVAGGAAFYLVTEITNNTATTYTDKASDGDLLKNKSFFVNDLSNIRKCKYVVYHIQSFRWFASGNPDNPTAIYVSQSNMPSTYDPTLTLFPITGEGPVTALATFVDSVLVFFKNTIYRYKGVEPSETGNWNQLPIKQGTIAPRSICLTSNALIFLGNGGIYAITPNVLNITGNISLSQNLIPNIADKKVSKKLKKIVHPGTACACWDANNDMLLLAVCDIEGDTSDANNKILTMDWNKRAFSWWEGMNIYEIVFRNDKSILWGTDNFIAKYGTGYRDIGDIPIYGKVKTRQYDCGSPIHIKKFMRAYVAALQLPEWSYHLSLNVRCGYSFYDLAEVSLDESFDWGKEWGLTWGHIDIITLEYKLRKISGHRIQFTFENNELDEPMATYGIAVKRMFKRAKGTKKIK